MASRFPFALLAVTCTTLLAGCATENGSPERWLLQRSEAGAWITIDAGGSRFTSIEPAHPAALAGVGEFGVAAHAFAGPTLGWVGGLDAHVGASWPAGGLYDLNVCPLGLGIFFHGVLVGAMGGVGVGGIVARIPVALQLPVEAVVDADLGPFVHLGGWASARWVVGAASRRDGAAHAPFGDELSTGVMIRIGHGEIGTGERWGNGPFLAGTYDELVGGHAWGGLFGYSITMSGRP